MLPCEILTCIGIGAILVIAFWPLVRKCCEEEEDVPAPTPLLTVEDDQLEKAKRQLYMKQFNKLIAFLIKMNLVQ